MSETKQSSKDLFNYFDFVPEENVISPLTFMFSDEISSYDNKTLIDNGFIDLMSTFNPLSSLKQRFILSENFLDIKLDDISSSSYNEVFSSEEQSLISEDREINQKKAKDNRLKFSSHFITQLLEDNFEYGYTNSSEHLLNDAITQYGSVALTWVEEIFLDQFSHPEITSRILRILGHFPYKVIHPQGETMALAALAHYSFTVKESAIRAFENWNCKDCLVYLTSLNISENWLKTYLEQVIVDLSKDE